MVEPWITFRPRVCCVTFLSSNSPFLSTISTCLFILHPLARLKHIDKSWCTTAEILLHLSSQSFSFLQIRVWNSQIQPGTLMDGASEFHTSLTWLIWLAEMAEIENSDPKVCSESGWFHLAESLDRGTGKLSNTHFPLCWAHAASWES